MERRRSAGRVAGLLLGTLVVFGVMVLLLPVLTRMLKIEAVSNQETKAVQAGIPGKPEELLVTVVYEMEENSKKITSIYIEVFHVGLDTVTYLEIPVDTRVTLSEELYKSLQTYAPELPQYMKLSNMAESFSDGYGLTGCNRILSEVLGVSLEQYVRADADCLEAWFAAVTGEKTATDFFKEYSEWVGASGASLTTEERWMYYESWMKVGNITTETAPGSRDKDGYLISGKRSGELLEEMMIRREPQKD